MSGWIIPSRDLTEAWLDTVAAVTGSPAGRQTNFITWLQPDASGSDPRSIAVLDGALAAKRLYTVATVANTLFPAALYRAPDVRWSPDLNEAQLARLDTAAQTLYTSYLTMLPALRRVPGSRRGTYFGQLVSWSGRIGTGRNQLEEKIAALRLAHTRGLQTENSNSLILADDADAGIVAAAGLQELAPDDRRTQGFPCLVHLDLGVADGRLSLTALYRHWYLLSRGYGNLVGLRRLQDFLCQQTGYDRGELAVVGAYANAEHRSFNGRRGVGEILAAVRATRSATAA